MSTAPITFIDDSGWYYLELVLFFRSTLVANTFLKDPSGLEFMVLAPSVPEIEFIVFETTVSVTF